MEGHDPHRWQRRQVDAALDKIRVFHDECQQSQAWARHNLKIWRQANMTLSVFVAVIAAIAGASVLGDLAGTTVTASLALAAAGLSAVNAAIRPNERVGKWESFENAFRILVVEADSYLSLDALLPMGKLDAPYLARDFAERRIAVLSGKPLPEMWAKGHVAHAYRSDEELAWLME